MTHAQAGRRAEAERALAELYDRRERDNIIPLALAFAHISLGDPRFADVLRRIGAPSRVT